MLLLNCLHREIGIVGKVQASSVWTGETQILYLLEGERMDK